MGRKKRVAGLVIIILLMQISLALADNVSFDSVTQSWKVTCDHASPEKAVSFLAVRGSEDSYTISEQTIAYLNQMKADKNGQIEVLLIGKMTDRLVFLMGGAANEDALHLIGSVDMGADLARTVMPEALVSIEEEAFMGSSVQYVIIGNNVESIGNKAFSDCSGLFYIEIPSSVSEFGTDIFKGSPNVIIRCEENSPAHLYATNEGIEFELTGGN